MPTFEEFLKNLILTGSTVLIGRIYNNYKTKSFTISTSTIKVTHTRLVELKKWFNFSFYFIAFLLYCYSTTFPKGQRAIPVLFFLFILIIINGSFYELMEYAASNTENVADNNAGETVVQNKNTDDIWYNYCSCNVFYSCFCFIHPAACLSLLLQICNIFVIIFQLFGKKGVVCFVCKLIH